MRWGNNLRVAKEKCADEHGAEAWVVGTEQETLEKSSQKEILQWPVSQARLDQRKRAQGRQGGLKKSEVSVV